MALDVRYGRRERGGGDGDERREREGMRWVFRRRRLFARTVGGYFEGSFTPDTSSIHYALSSLAWGLVPTWLTNSMPPVTLSMKTA